MVFFFPSHPTSCNFEQRTEVPSLSVSKSDRVKIIGIARDFTTCSYMEKKRRCGMVIDARATYCEDHLIMHVNNARNDRMAVGTRYGTETCFFLSLRVSQLSWLCGVTASVAWRILPNQAPCKRRPNHLLRLGIRESSPHRQ